MVHPQNGQRPMLTAAQGDFFSNGIDNVLGERECTAVNVGGL
jgi:hypothetical protein